MASFRYYSLPGFGEKCREEYGFSDSCIIGDRMFITGQTGMDPLTQQTSSNFDDEVAQAFKNVNDIIVHTLDAAGLSAKLDQRTGWNYVVKIRAYVVGLSKVQEKARIEIVRNIKMWCPEHQPLFTLVGVESLPFPEHHVEIEADIWVR